MALVPSTWDNDVVRPPTPPPKDDSNPSNLSESRKPDTDKQPKNSKDRSSKNKKDNKKSRQ